MKLQDLNRSFAKVLAAVAIAFTISAAPAQAQQAQWGADRCYYIAQGGQWVRQGCMLQLNGNQFYYDIRTSVMTDPRTRSSFRLAQQNGRLYVNAGTGWVDAGPAPAGLVPNQATGTAGGTCVPHTGAGWVGTGCPTPESRYPDVDAIPRRSQQTGVDIWLAPNCTGSYGGCR